MSIVHRLQYAGFLAGSSLLRALPEDLARRLAIAGGHAWFARGGKHVRHALTNLAIAFPDQSEERRREIARASYGCFAQNLVEVVRAEDLSDTELSQRVRIEGREHVDKALAQGRGALLLTLHLGNFEIALMAGAAAGLPLVAVGRPMANTLLYARLARNRTRTGSELIDRRRAAPGILRALRQGKGVVIVNDQYSRRARGVFVPFFGARCSTSAGVATLSRRAKAPVVPAYTVRVAPGRHVVRFFPALDPEPPPGEDPIEGLTARYNAVLEGFVREYPEQWMWAHRRFRHSPDLPDLDYA